MTKSKNSDFKQLLTKDSLLTRKMRSGRMIHGKKPPKEEMETKFPNRSKLFFPRKGIPLIPSRNRREKSRSSSKISFSLSTTDRLLRSMGETLKRWIPMVIGYTARKTILETRTCTSSSSTVPTTYDVNRIEAEDRSKRAKRKRKNWAGEGRGRNRDRIERESWHHPGHAGSRLRSS